MEDSVADEVSGLVQTKADCSLYTYLVCNKTCDSKPQAVID